MRQLATGGPMQRHELSPAQVAYLDLLRAAAAMMVLLGHAAIYFDPQSWAASSDMQSVGVSLFFLISGFLISLSVLQKLDDSRYGFGAYFIDRFCRIYTAFLPALVFVLLVDTFIAGAPTYAWRRDFNVQTWIGNLLMFQDYPLFQILRRLGFPDSPWFVSCFGSARPFWTISIEWWIYMLFGGIMFFWVRRGGERGPLAVVALAVVAVEPFYHFIGGFAQCLTMLWMIGMGASILFHKLPALRARFPQLGRPGRLPRIALAVALGSTVCIIGRLYANGFRIYELQLGLFLAGLVFALLFALGFVRRVPTAIARPIGFVAGYSYSLYLIHFTVLELLRAEHPELIGSPTSFWAAVAICNLAAILFWFVFERHHRQIARAAKARLGMGRKRPVGGFVRS
jgi:peptidoglycan/LPS O-acetylase OafA/YrhL